jgi:hypothetical protein
MKLYTISFILQIAIEILQWLGMLIQDSFPINRILYARAYRLKYAITILQVVLVVPYIFSQICKFSFKILVWPLDVYYYNGFCTFNYK